MIVSIADSSVKKMLTREAALFLGLLFFGLILMPMAIYLVGQGIFGAYGGHGYGDFFGNLSAKIRAGELVAWFLVLSPYLAWQTLRVTILSWRYVRKTGR